MSTNAGRIHANARRDSLGLRADCGNCFALCCVALAFEKSSDFPVSTAAGEPCRNLQVDFRCGIHATLRRDGWKGCTVYDCFGAGQKVSQQSFGGTSWRQAPETQRDMFALLPVMRQLHELLWYLSDAIERMPGLTAPEQPANPGLLGALHTALAETDAVTRLLPAQLLGFDLDAHRAGVNALLLRLSEAVRSRHPESSRVDHRGADLIGAKLRGADLRGASLRGASLIAADLCGADLRDADLIGADLRDAQLADADLSTALFLAQTQLNAAIGNAATRIPAWLGRPAHWS